MAFAFDSSTDEDHSDVDPHTDLEGSSRRSGGRRADHPGGVDHAESGAHCMFGIGFTTERRSPRREEPVSGVFEHPAVRRLDHGGEPPERVVDQLVEVLRIEMPAGRRRSNGVDEQDREVPNAGAVRYDAPVGERLAKWHQSHLGRRVPEHVTLCLDGRNRVLDPWDVGMH